MLLLVFYLLRYILIIYSKPKINNFSTFHYIYAADDRVRKPCSELLTPYQSAVAFMVSVELFKRAGRDLIERNFSDFWDDLIEYSLLIGCLRVILILIQNIEKNFRRGELYHNRGILTNLLAEKTPP